MNLRSWLVLLHDLVAVAMAWCAAFWLRFNFDIPAEFSGAMWNTLPLVLAVYATSFLGFGLYRGVWRFASIPDLQRILTACGLAALATPAVLLLLGTWTNIPRSALVLTPLLLVIVMGGARFGYRSWKDGSLNPRAAGRGTPVLVLGAGEAAATLVRELSRSESWNVVGMLDDNPAMHNLQVGGIRVLGPISAVASVAEATQASHAIIAMPSATAAQRRHAAEMAAASSLAVLTVPAIEDLLSGRVAISSIRKVELEDLLGRERIELDDAGIKALIAGQVVMVTGAGGSIGAELCRQLARYAPSRLLLLELSEVALYTIAQELAEERPALTFNGLIGDVKDQARIEHVLQEYRPRVLFHAAAYKHVPIMEEENAREALRNNTLGTLCLAQAAIHSGVEKFVLISTDKAVNPTNVMGASKRLAERACLAAQAQGGQTQFVIVRFGNVLGSSGSVIPKFREQIARGGPVTVTHPEIIRYFMLIPEAVQLVLQAALMGRGSEIYVLDMGEPVKIIDLARDLIRLSGFTEDEIGIEFTGLRPGEKLFEELLADSETTLPTPHPKLRIARSESTSGPEWLFELEAWLEGLAQDPSRLKTELRGWLPDYRPPSD